MHRVQKHVFCTSCTLNRRLFATAAKEQEDKLKIKAKPPDSSTKNWIGPPDQVSNIRPIKFHTPADETTIERNFRQRQTETIQWNHNFWQEHNARFFKEKEEFVEKVKETTGSKPSSEELSQFYRGFLDENRKSHLSYNRELYRRNISILWPALQVAVIRAVRRVKRIKS